MENIQTNAIIEVPRMGISLEVQLPPRETPEAIIYSISGNRNNLVFLDARLLPHYTPASRRLVYEGDSLHTNGSWMQEQRGRRIC